MAYILRRRKLGLTSCKGIASKSTKGIGVIRNDKVLPEADLIIRWGCTSNVPSRNVLNTSSAIHEVNDKLAFRKKLDAANLCTTTYFNVEDAFEVVEGSEAHTDRFSLIVRPHKHAQGRNLHMCHTLAELYEACARYPQYYISEFMDKVAEYRVFVVQGRAVCVAQKTPGNPEDVAWNVAQGGRFDNVSWDNWPLKAVKRSIEAFNLSSLDFGGVDVMVDAEGNTAILEINSAPSLTSDYRQECFAKAFDYIIENGKERIPLVEAKGGYRKFIHPAVCDRAQLVTGE